MMYWVGDSAVETGILGNWVEVSVIGVVIKPYFYFHVLYSLRKFSLNPQMRKRILLFWSLVSCMSITRCFRLKSALCCLKTCFHNACKNAIMFVNQLTNFNFSVILKKTCKAPLYVIKGFSVFFVQPFIIPANTHSFWGEVG